MSYKIKKWLSDLVLFVVNITVAGKAQLQKLQMHLREITGNLTAIELSLSSEPVTTSGHFRLSQAQPWVLRPAHRNALASLSAKSAHRSHPEKEYVHTAGM